MRSQRSAPVVAGAPSVCTPWDSARWKIKSVGKEVEIPRRTPKPAPESLFGGKKKTVHDRLYKEFYDKALRQWDREQKNAEAEAEVAQSMLKKPDLALSDYGTHDTLTEGGVQDAIQEAVRDKLEDQVKAWINFRNHNERTSKRKREEPYKDDAVPAVPRYIAANAPLPMKGNYPRVKRGSKAKDEHDVVAQEMNKLKDAAHTDDTPMTPPTRNRRGVEIKSAWSNAIPSPGAYVLDTPPPFERHKPAHKIEKPRMIKDPPKISRAAPGVLDPRLRFNPDGGALFVRTQDDVAIKPALDNTSNKIKAKRRSLTQLIIRSTELHFGAPRKGVDVLRGAEHIKKKYELNDRMRFRGKRKALRNMEKDAEGPLRAKEETKKNLDARNRSRKRSSSPMTKGLRESISPSDAKMDAKRDAKRDAKKKDAKKGGKKDAKEDAKAGRDKSKEKSTKEKDSSPSKDGTDEAGSPRKDATADSGTDREAALDSDEDHDDAKSAASHGTEKDDRRKSVYMKTPREKLYSARIKILAMRAFIESLEGLDKLLHYGNKEKERDHVARELDYREGVDGATDLMRSWGQYRRSSFGLNPGGSTYGAKNPVSWSDLEGSVPFLQVGPENIMQAIRDAVEETVGRRLPYDWSFPKRPEPDDVDIDAQPDLMDDATYMRFKTADTSLHSEDLSDSDDSPAAINKTLIAQFKQAHNISEENSEEDETDVKGYAGLRKADTLDFYY